MIALFLLIKKNVILMEVDKPNFKEGQTEK